MSKRSIWNITFGIILVGSLIVFIITHFEETQRLLEIIKGVQPWWLLLAALLQIVTYFFAGLVWHLIAKTANYHLSLKSMTELSIEQLSINQLVPAGGIAGNATILRALMRHGVPQTLAVEVVFVDTLAFYISFSFMTLISLAILSFHHNLTPIILSVVFVFFIVGLLIIGTIWATVNHKRLKIPAWIRNRPSISKLLETIEHISAERVFSMKLLFETSLLRLGIFLLDVVTLFAVLESIDIKNSLSAAFVAFILASVAGTVTLLPGGLGGFEAGSITILALFGIPISSAVAGTLLLRGLTLWLPLIPGLILAREDLGLSRKIQK